MRDVCGSWWLVGLQGCWALFTLHPLPGRRHCCGAIGPFSRATTIGFEVMIIAFSSINFDGEIQQPKCKVWGHQVDFKVCILLRPVFLGFCGVGMRHHPSQHTISCTGPLGMSILYPLSGTYVRTLHMYVVEA